MGNLVVLFKANFKLIKVCIGYVQFSKISKLLISPRINLSSSLGRVYNATAYIEYHPGGVDELMKGAGKDATALFDEV